MTCSAYNYVALPSLPSLPSMSIGWSETFAEVDKHCHDGHTPDFQEIRSPRDVGYYCKIRNATRDLAGHAARVDLYKC